MSSPKMAERQILEQHFGMSGAGEPRDAGLLGRATKGEVVLVSRLRAALERLNPTLPPEAITAARLFQLFTRLLVKQPSEFGKQTHSTQ